MTDRCLDTQLLAAFAERRLKRSEMPEVLAHLEHCAACMSSLRAAMDLMEPPKEARRWWPIAAAIAVVLGAAPFVYRAIRSTETDQLVRVAPRSARVVEARLSGGFEWAPYRAPMRSAGEKPEAQRMKLIGAAGELVERADNEKTAEAQHAAGIGLVLVEKPEDAIPRLRTATEHSPADARAWSDLAAAEYMTALRLGRASLYPVALAHADRALRADPNLTEALFNRALILERLGLTQVAREAWSAYLRTDPSSQWASEAREHLKRLPASTGQSQFKRDQPRLERAAASVDQAAVDAFVDRYRQESRTWAEAEYLGRWAEAERSGHGDEAPRELAIARAIGSALARLSGELLLRDSVAAIDTSSPQTRAAIAEAPSHTGADGSRTAGASPPRPSPTCAAQPRCSRTPTIRCRSWRATSPRVPVSIRATSPRRAPSSRHCAMPQTLAITPPSGRRFDGSWRSARSPMTIGAPPRR